MKPETLLRALRACEYNHLKRLDSTRLHIYGTFKQMSARHKRNIRLASKLEARLLERMNGSCKDCYYAENNNTGCRLFCGGTNPDFGCVEWRKRR